MSQERKDVRLKLTVEEHQALVALADLEEKDISEVGSALLGKILLGELHAKRVVASRMARWGTSGNPGESPGIPRKGPLKSVR